MFNFTTNEDFIQMRGVNGSGGVSLKTLGCTDCCCILYIPHIALSPQTVKISFLPHRLFKSDRAQINSISQKAARRAR